MNVEISADSLAFLQSQVVAGRYASETEALNDAISLLRRTAALREKIQRGFRQLEEGDYIELDEEGMDEFFAQLLDNAEPTTK